MGINHKAKGRAHKEILSQPTDVFQHIFKTAKHMTIMMNGIIQIPSSLVNQKADRDNPRLMDQGVRPFLDQLCLTKNPTAEAITNIVSAG